MKPSKPLKIIQALFPWLVAAALLAYLFQKVPPAQLWVSFRKAQVIPFLLFAVAYFAVIASLDTLGLTWVLSRFGKPIRMGEIWPGRCVSYLLSLINYNAGQGALAAYLRKTKKFSFFKTLGSVFFVTATDLYWIIILAFVGSFFIELSLKGVSLTDWVQRIAYVAFAGFFLHLAFWHRWFSKILPFKVHFAFVDWIRGRHLFQAFHHAKIRDYLKIALLRLPLHLFFISSMWVLVRIFGGTISWQDVFATVPIIFLLGALPLTPGGLGAVQIATVELLKNEVHSPNFLPGSQGAEEMLFALSLSWMAANYLLKTLLGIFYLIKEPAGLFKSQNEPKSNAAHQDGDS